MTKYYGITERASCNEAGKTRCLQLTFQTRGTVYAHAHTEYQNGSSSQCTSTFLFSIFTIIVIL